MIYISKLTFLGFYLNGALGSGNYDHISIKEVKSEIDNGTIFEFLSTELGSDIDLSSLDSEDKEVLVDEWQNLVNAVDEDRKMCVTRKGICLLVAYILEGIQRRVRDGKDLNP